ncbi:MAG TPA: DUF721 domain-containing protein [Bacteroidetes bacterium]|nr:DUF721 domain-containing protein [Bacteroidota bacterium]
MDKEQRLSDVLKEMVDSLKWKNKLNETKIRQIWMEKMGTTINHHTKDIRLRKDKLYILIESSSLKQELSYEREKIKDMMNRELGSDCLKEVIVR